MNEHARPGLVDWLGAGAAGGATGALVAALTTVLAVGSAFGPPPSPGPMLGLTLVYVLVFVPVGAAMGAVVGLVFGAITGGLGLWRTGAPSRWRMAIAGVAVQTATLALVSLNAGPATWLLFGVPGGLLGGLMAARRLRATTS